MTSAAKLSAADAMPPPSGSEAAGPCGACGERLKRDGDESGCKMGGRQKCSPDALRSARDVVCLSDCGAGGEKGEDGGVAFVFIFAM